MSTVSASSSSPSSYRTALPSLQHLMIQAPLLFASKPMSTSLLDPYARGLAPRPVLAGSTSPILSARADDPCPQRQKQRERYRLLVPPPIRTDRGSSALESSSSSSSSNTSSSSSSSITRDDRREPPSSFSSSASSSSSTRHPISGRGAPLSRRANACHSCRIRKTRCVPSSELQAVQATGRTSSSSTTKSPCTRCTQSGVPCDYSVLGREREHDSKQSYRNYLRARDRSHTLTNAHAHSNPHRNNKVDKYEYDDDVSMDDHIFDEPRLDDGNKDLGHVNGRVPVSSRYPPHMSGPTIERRNKDRPRDVGDVLKHDEHEHEDDDDVCCSVQADIPRSTAYETGPNGTTSNLLSPPYHDLLPWSSVRIKSPFDLAQSHRSPGDVSPKTIAFDPLWPSMAAWHS